MESIEVNSHGMCLTNPVDEKENAKAHGHTTGGGHLPKRNFLGLTKDQAKALRDEFQPDVQSSTQTPKWNSQKATK